MLYESYCMCKSSMGPMVLYYACPEGFPCEQVLVWVPLFILGIPIKLDMPTQYTTKYNRLKHKNQEITKMPQVGNRDIN